MARRVVMMPAGCEVSATVEISWAISILTVPPSETCGRTRSMVPTSLRSTVWNGLDSVLLVVAYWPVTKGTFWPMMMRASSLSSVSRFGVARMLPLASVSSARASRPRFRKF